MKSYLILAKTKYSLVPTCCQNTSGYSTPNRGSSFLLPSSCFRRQQHLGRFPLASSIQRLLFAPAACADINNFFASWWHRLVMHNATPTKITMASVVETKQRGRAVDLILVHIMDLIRHHQRIYEQERHTRLQFDFFVTVRDQKNAG